MQPLAGNHRIGRTSVGAREELDPGSVHVPDQLLVAFEQGSNALHQRSELRIR